MTSPERRVALVTGAARGIGLATANALARSGVDIVLVDLPSSPLGGAATLVSAHVGRAVVFEGDVSSEQDWEAAIARCREAFGRLDILINNAGVSGPIGPLVDCSVEAFDRVQAVNTRGVFLGMKHAAASLIERRGAIVNVSSISGLGGGRNTIAYTASKHAVVGMTKLAAMEFAGTGVRVNAVCPAPTSTDMTLALARQMRPDDPDSFPEDFAKFIPLGRYGEPPEIADAIVFLASDAASFITGVALPVDGGACAR